MYEFRSLHLIATLLRESRNNEGVILQWDITKKVASGVSYLLGNGPGSCSFLLFIWV